MKRKFVSLNVLPSTKERLIKRMSYGDSIDKAITQLLDIADKLDNENKGTKLPDPMSDTQPPVIPQ